MRIFLVVFIFFSALATFATADVSIRTEAPSDSVTVGQRVRIVYEVTFPESLAFVTPETIDPGNCRLLDLDWSQSSGRGEGTVTGRLTVLPVSLEDAFIPAPSLVFVTPHGDTVFAVAERVELPIKPLAGDAAEPKPLKPQWVAPRSYLYYYLGGALLLLLLAGIYLWRRRKKKPVVEAPKPELPEDFVALRSLAEIEKMGLLEKREFKQYYTLVVDVLRHYVERRFAIQVMDRTTGEILADLDHGRMSVDGLEAILREADLVKFAKFEPDVAMGKHLMENTRSVIATTARRPAATGE